jgi:hypothetical protein
MHPDIEVRTDEIIGSLPAARTRTQRPLREISDPRSQLGRNREFASIGLRYRRYQGSIGPCSGALHRFVNARNRATAGLQANSFGKGQQPEPTWSSGSPANAGTLRKSSAPAMKLCLKRSVISRVPTASVFRAGSFSEANAHPNISCDRCPSLSL